MHDSHELKRTWSGLFPPLRFIIQNGDANNTDHCCVTQQNVDFLKLSKWDSLQKFRFSNSRNLRFWKLESCDFYSVGNVLAPIYPSRQSTFVSVHFLRMWLLTSHWKGLLLLLLIGLVVQRPPDGGQRLDARPHEADDDVMHNLEDGHLRHRPML